MSKVQNESRQLLSMAEAGEISGYHPDYLSALARQGKLEGQKVGRNWLVTRQALNNFLGIGALSESASIEEVGALSGQTEGALEKLLDRIGSELNEKKSAQKVEELKSSLALVKAQLQNSHLHALGQMKRLHELHIAKDWPGHVHPKLGRSYSHIRQIGLAVVVALGVVLFSWVFFLSFVM